MSINESLILELNSEIKKIREDISEIKQTLRQTKENRSWVFNICIPAIVGLIASIFGVRFQ